MNLSVLILEDEYDKMVEIVQTIVGEGIDIEFIRQVTNANDARREMRLKQYDLLILDMNVPAMIGAPATADGGISLLKMLKLDLQINFPLQVIGITAKEDLFEDSNKQMNAMSWTLCRYEPANDIWRNQLSEKIRYLKKMKGKMITDIYPNYDIVLITALREIEFDAVLNLPLDWEERYFEGDPVCYHEGKLMSKFGPLRILAASSLRMGMPSAAALAMKMTAMFTPKVLAMVGICAGKKDVTALGDIIVADPVWDWGSGKIKEENGKEVFAISPHQLSIDSAYRSKIKSVKDNKELITEIRSHWTEAVPEGLLKVHIGPMASGASVVANAEKMASIELQNRGMIGLEMEAYAVMAASEYSNSPRPKPVVIKSVCDFGDSEKHSKWQRYAAYTSAQMFFILFRDHLRTN